MFGLDFEDEDEDEDEISEPVKQARGFTYPLSRGSVR